MRLSEDVLCLVPYQRGLYTQKHDLHSLACSLCGYQRAGYLCADTGEGVGKVIELFSPVGRRGSFCSFQVYNLKRSSYTVVKRESVSSKEYSEVLELTIGPS